MSEQIQISDGQNSFVPAKNEKDGLKGVPSNKSNINQLRNVIKMAVARAYKSTGKPLDKQDGTFIIDELKEEILRVFPGIRIEEIGLAIHKGAMGEFGIVYNLSLAAFVGFIRSYMASTERIEAAKKYIKQLDFVEIKNKPTEEEISKSKKQIAINAFSQFKEKGFYNDHGNYVFESLVDFGAVNLTEEQKEKIWLKAKSKVINTVSAPSRTIDERNENQRILKEISEKKEHTLIYIEAKKIALQKLFSELKDMDVELSDLIEL